VQTSVTAFIGTIAGGALNQPVHLLTFADFELNFGGLTPDRELGYSVRQFFLNGGIEAWVLRVPDNPTEEHWRDGIRALDSVDLFNLLVLPTLSRLFWVLSGKAPDDCHNPAVPPTGCVASRAGSDAPDLHSGGFSVSVWIGVKLHRRCLPFRQVTLNQMVDRAVR
jgi:hypothetical protein